MKNYEEMTRSVIEKAKFYKENQRNKRRNLAVGAVTCACSLALAAVFGVKMHDAAEVRKNATTMNWVLQSQKTTVEQSEVTAPEQQVTPDEDASVVNPPVVDTEKPRFTLLCTSYTGGPANVLAEKVGLPYNAELRVRDVTDMTEEERQKIIEEENAYIQQLFGEDRNGDAYGRYCRDNVIVTMIQQGSISLAFDNIESVENAQISVTENGYIFYPRISGIKYKTWDETGRTVEIDGDRLRDGLDMLGTDKFDMYWQFAPEVVDKIDNDPDVKLSGFSDKITIKVEYTDGRVEMTTLKIQVSDDGKTTVMLDGTEII